MSYRLYAGRLQDVPEGSYSFYDSGTERLLVVSEKPPRGAFIEVPDELLHQLSWYSEVVLDIDRKFVKEHPTEAFKEINDLLDAWERELQNEVEHGREERDAPAGVGDHQQTE